MELLTLLFIIVLVIVIVNVMEQKNEEYKLKKYIKLNDDIISLQENMIKLEYKRTVKLMNEKGYSDDRHDYIISNEDYIRNHPVDANYMKKYKLKLFALYENKCIKCGNDSNGADVDHFMFSKREGGSFVMKHKNGYLINNAILLCQTCNRSKSDKSYRDEFSQEVIEKILEKNNTMTELINKDVAIDKMNGVISSITGDAPYVLPDVKLEISEEDVEITDEYRAGLDELMGEGFADRTFRSYDEMMAKKKVA